MAKRRESKLHVSEAIEQIKKLIVKGLFNDSWLVERFVLKGGNAIDLIFRIGSRASADIDLSMPDDFRVDELPEVRSRIETALVNQFSEIDLVPFDVRLESKPAEISADLRAFWGGYRVTFKLINSGRYQQLRDDVLSLNRNALLVGASSKLQIDISKHEYCAPREEHHLDGVRVLVYSPAMLACEKLRAICQQTEEYGIIVKRSARPPAPRARDFVDIHLLMRHFGFDLAVAEHWPLIRATFEAKRVPLELLGRIGEYREFHRSDFPAVKDSAKPGVKLNEFDDYFDDVLQLCDRLKPFWNS
jgi:Nucleotidyl transferase AbiEii toxin, Type IV TA system